MIQKWLAQWAAQLIAAAVVIAALAFAAHSYQARGARIAELTTELARVKAEHERDAGINRGNQVAIATCRTQVAGMVAAADATERNARAAMARAVQTATDAAARHAARRQRAEAPSPDEYNAVLLDLVPRL